MSDVEEVDSSDEEEEKKVKVVKVDEDLHSESESVPEVSSTGRESFAKIFFVLFFIRSTRPNRFHHIIQSHSKKCNPLRKYSCSAWHRALPAGSHNFNFLLNRRKRLANACGMGYN